MISDGLWTRRFGRDTRVIGRALPVVLKTGDTGDPLTIIGVMPQGFDFPRGTEIWMPAAPQVRMGADEWTGGDVEAAVKWLRVFYGIGRLRSGVTPDMAARELSGVIRTTDTRGGPEPPTDAVVTPVRSYLLGPAEPVLWTLLGGAALMLLVACANVAGLQLVGVRSHDPIALLTSAAVAFAVGLTACWWPSRRAACADPVEALRAE